MSDNQLIDLSKKFAVDIVNTCTDMKNTLWCVNYRS